MLVVRVYEKAEALLLCVCVCAMSQHQTCLDVCQMG